MSSEHYVRLENACFRSAASHSISNDLRLLLRKSTMSAACVCFLSQVSMLGMQSDIVLPVRQSVRPSNAGIVTKQMDIVHLCKEVSLAAHSGFYENALYKFTFTYFTYLHF